VVPFDDDPLPRFRGVGRCHFQLGADAPTIADSLPRPMGLDSFRQVDAIRYTFNAELPGVNLARSWFGSPRPAKFPLRGRTRTASR